MPAFNLQKIRPHGGSQYHGFEELCTQLLSLEPRPASASFYRKGGSADAGVEAYIEFDTGNQHCLQAKFYDQLTSDLVSKLMASLIQALDNHPKLVKYIVCLPFNLRDAGKFSTTSTTEMDRWKAWKDKAQAEARKRSRVLAIELWDASAIHTKLTSGDGRYAGRLRYWLDQEAFSENWFAKRWQEARAVLGERYLPEFNVKTPARQLIHALVRSPNFFAHLEALAGQALDAVANVQGALARALKASPATTPPATDLLAPVVALCGTLRPRDIDIDDVYDVEAWRDDAKAARQSMGDLLHWCWDVRFTFERMSDHEIAREILRKHFDHHSIAHAFTAGTPLGDTLRSTDWGLESVIQALAIQIAEEHGAELGDIVPAKYVPGIWGGRENFLDTVHWRSAQSVTQRTLHWIEDAVDSDGLAGFYIEFGPQVGSAFNADWLHQRLAGMTMPERDLDWSVTVNRLGFDDGGSIQTVVDWALASGRRITDSVRAELLGTTLTWLLTTSHREVRDKATKALACVLSGSTTASLALLEKFRTVDDGYLQERLYAAVYGAALQASWSAAEYAPIANFVLKEFFGPGTAIHALTRDYARGIVEIAVRMGVISDDQASVARPPYQGNWSVDLVPEEALASFVWPAGSDVKDDIVHSCLHDDFEHYTIPSKTQSFGCSPRAASSVISTYQLAALWLNHFESWAGQDARDALDALLKARREVVAADRSDRERWNKLEAAAKLVLERFKSEVGSLVAENFRVCASSGDLFVPEAKYVDGRARFDTLWAAKWVAKHAHDLGWSAKDFEGAEQAFRPTQDRMDHRVERLGKKYQWLALHELVGRLSDSVQLLSGCSENNPESYQGPWQVSARDIDPSMLRRSTKDDGWKAWSPTWWMPKQAKLSCRTPQEAMQWLTSEVDIVNDEQLIDLVDIDGRRWLSLHGAGSWNRMGKRQHPQEVTRKSWVHIHCLIVSPADEEKLVTALTRSKAESHPDLPDGDGFSEAFLGEYGWHPSAKGLDEWHAASTWKQRLPRLLVPTVQYSHAKGYDYSTDGTCNFRMPGAWLCAGLGLHLSNGSDLTWTDGKRTTFFDPAVMQDGPSAALVDRDAFLGLVQREGLRAVWVLYGEKELYGPHSGGDAFGGRLHHLGVYRHEGADSWKVDKYRWHLKPSAGQISAFMKCC